MSLSGISFENISEQDLLNQIQTSVPEGVLVDYKRDTYGRTDADVREFLKDISSFANAAGGHLIIGIDESGGIPTGLVPFTGNVDHELQRFENMASAGLEPRIVGLRMKAVPVTGGHAIVFRIPKSWNPPHRVSARNTNRIYGRNSAGTFEFSVEELRVVFTAAANALDRVRALRAERLAKIDAGEAIVPLAVDLGRLVLHIVPLSSFGVTNQIDLDQAHRAEELLRPLASMGRSPRINFDGFINLFHGADSRCWSYTQLFRNGVIEAVKIRVAMERNGELIIPTLDFDKHIFEVLPGYLDALQQLEVPPPLVVMISLQGVRGARIGVAPQSLDAISPIDRTTLELPEIVIENYGTETEIQRTMRPAFDALWSTGGYLRSTHFDDTGRWDPNRRRT